MERLNTLLTERARKWERMKEITDGAATRGDNGENLTAEEAQEWDRLEADLRKDSEEIERLERQADLDRQMRTVRTDPTVTPPPGDPGDDEDPDPEKSYREAFQAYVTRGMADLEAELRAVLRTGWRPDGDQRAAAIGTGSAGGYLVPQGFRQQIVEKMKDYGAVMDVATVLNTDTGNPLPWPTNDDTGNVGALLAENTQATEQDITLGTAQLGAYKYTSKVIRVSIEFLQDVNWLDAEAFLRRKFAERLGRIHNQHFTTGTGSSQPQGIVTGSISGVTAASATTFTLDELIDLEHSVDPAYRKSANVQFMLADAALKIARKVKDTTGQYIWQPSVQAGVPSTLMGYGYVINQDMPALTTGNKPVLFGDFEAGYVVRLVKAFELIRMNERWADYGQVGFVAFDRADGLVQDNSAYKALTLA